MELLGPDGLLSQVTKAVLERALAEEMTGHLGYEKHDPGGRGSGNSRNGTTPKTVLTDAGAVGLAVPRDRAGSFEPKMVRKGQARLEGFNERIIALYARGMATRDIRAHLRESGATRRWPGCGAAARILSPAWPAIPSIQASACGRMRRNWQRICWAPHRPSPRMRGRG